MSVRNTARQALDDEEAPERRAREEAQRAAEVRKREEQDRHRRLAAELLDASPLPRWFPSTRWVVEAWDYELDAPIFRPDPDEYPIRLMVRPGGEVRTVEEAHSIERAWDGRTHPHRAHAYTRPGEVWWGPLATSAADVGRMVRRHDDIMSSMPDHLP